MSEETELIHNLIKSHWKEKRRCRRDDGRIRNGMRGNAKSKVRGWQRDRQGLRLITSPSTCLNTQLHASKRSRGARKIAMHAVK